MGNIALTWLGIRASGITAWGLLTAVVLWGILLKTQLLGRLAPPMKLLDLHRWLGAIAIVFLLAHMVLLFVDTYQHYSVAALLVPGMAPAPLTFAAALGTIAFWLMMPVSFLGRIRAKMGLVGNAWFKRSHLIAYAAWPFATAHYVLAGTDALAQWSLALLFTATALIVMALLARGFVPAPGPVRTITPRRSTTAV
jgi:methionine sulfoxide reductase heme-binding subunit